MKLETNFFSDKAACSLEENCRRFGGRCCFHMYRRSHRLQNIKCCVLRVSKRKSLMVRQVRVLWGELMGSWWKLINGEFHDICLSTNSIRLSKQKSMALAWHVLHMDSVRSTYKLKNLNVNYQFATWAYRTFEFRNNAVNYNDVNNQQGATTFSFINLFNSVLHVSGDKFAHPQEHVLTIHSFWYNAPTLLPTGATVEMERPISNVGPVGNSVGALYQKQYILTYLLTYLLTPWSRVLLEKLTSKLCS